jgi:hypothetical protein
MVDKHHKYLLQICRANLEVRDKWWKKLLILWKRVIQQIFNIHDVVAFSFFSLLFYFQKTRNRLAL